MATPLPRSLKMKLEKDPGKQRLLDWFNTPTSLWSGPFFSPRYFPYARLVFNHPILPQYSGSVQKWYEQGTSLERDFKSSRPGEAFSDLMPVGDRPTHRPHSPLVLSKTLHHRSWAAFVSPAETCKPMLITHFPPMILKAMHTLEMHTNPLNWILRREREKKLDFFHVGHVGSFTSSSHNRLLFTLSRFPSVDQRQSSNECMTVL